MATDVPADAATCSLPRNLQTRNVVIYGINKSLIYLAAPVLYVGMNQASLLNLLKYDNVVANLPASVYLWFTPLAVVVAWRFPLGRQLRPVLVVNYLLMALAGVLVAVMLALNWTAAVLPAVLLHAALLGVNLNVIEAYHWEVLGRGLEEKRRGEAFALAFGIGPVMAAIGSLAAQLVVSGEVLGFKVAMPGYPWNFAILFGASGPMMALAGLLSLRFEVPPDVVERPRDPFIRGVFGGFWEFLSDRRMAITVVAYILIYSGLLIMPSITLYTETATGRSAESLVNYQLALRFGGKAVLGFLLAALALRTSPRLGMIATALLCVAGPLWALSVSGLAFMVSFALLGAGELMGVYYPNYILSLSRPEHMRRNMAYAALIATPVGNAAVLYGAISEASSLQASFWTSVAISLSSIAICLLFLPAYPRPPEMKPASAA